MENWFELLLSVFVNVGFVVFIIMGLFSLMEMCLSGLCRFWI